MVYHERAAWSGLISTPVGIALYLTLLLGFRETSIVDTDWLWPMLWSIGAAVALSILLTIVWGIIVGRTDPAAASASDIRDRDISRMAGRVAYAFLIIAGLVVIALCALDVHVFWIANTMYAGFAVSSLIGDIARVIAYRRGLV